MFVFKFINYTKAGILKTPASSYSMCLQLYTCMSMLAICIPIIT